MSDQAVKLFEALSGVDEELLERCNRKANKKGTAAHRLFWRYGRAMAAGLCLIAVGAAAWGGYRLVMDKGSDSFSGGSNQAPPPAAPADFARPVEAADGMAGGAGVAPEASPEEETAPAGRGSSAGTESLVSRLQQSQTLTDNTDKAASMGASLEVGSTNDTGAEKDKELWEKEDALTDSRQSIPWAQACGTEPFDRYLPTALPSGYEPFSARQSASPKQWNNMIFKWSDGQQMLCLNMTMGEVRTQEQIDRSDGMDEYLAEGFTREQLPEPLEGRISFTLYYADGMRVDFAGYVTADEMWKLVEAIPGP